MRLPKRIEERRRAIRIEQSLAFKIGHEDFEVEATTINVSSHGVLCLVEKDIPLMTQLKVALRVPGSLSSKTPEKIVKAVGVVVRKERDDLSGKFFIAIYFSKITPNQQKILDTFVRKHLHA